MFALAASLTPAFDPSLRTTFTEFGQHAVGYGFMLTGTKAVFERWLIALMIWLMPGAHHARSWVIGLITWIVAVNVVDHFIPVILGNTFWWRRVRGAAESPAGCVGRRHLRIP